MIQDIPLECPIKKHMELKAVCLLCSLNGVIKIVKMLYIEQENRKMLTIQLIT